MGNPSWFKGYTFLTQPGRHQSGVEPSHSKGAKRRHASDFRTPHFCDPRLALPNPEKAKTAVNDRRR
jgi:hypothetical protein